MSRPNEIEYSTLNLTDEMVSLITSLTPSRVQLLNALRGASEETVALFAQTLVLIKSQPSSTITD